MLKNINDYLTMKSNMVNHGLFVIDIHVNVIPLRTIQLYETDVNQYGHRYLFHKLQDIGI